MRIGLFLLFWKTATFVYILSSTEKMLTHKGLCPKFGVNGEQILTTKPLPPHSKWYSIYAHRDAEEHWR